MKKIALIIASKDFRDEEYFIPKEFLSGVGYRIITVGDKVGAAMGSQGGEASIEKEVKDLNLDEFDAVVFIGGGGALENLDNEFSYRVAVDAVSKDIVLAAICIAPVILAKAGVLEGKKATVWTSSMNQEPARLLEGYKADYLKDDLVIDGRIITANGPLFALRFAEAIDKVLKKY